MEQKEINAVTGGGGEKGTALHTVKNQTQN